MIRQRLADAPEGSYTARLAAEGMLKVAQKLGEEAVELALAAAAQDRMHVVAEAADLVYHLLLLLRCATCGSPTWSPSSSAGTDQPRLRS